jgi:outer membrane receptor protein involved in Fe transport
MYFLQHTCRQRRALFAVPSIFGTLLSAFAGLLGTVTAFAEEQPSQTPQTVPQKAVVANSGSAIITSTGSGTDGGVKQGDKNVIEKSDDVQTVTVVAQRSSENIDRSAYDVEQKSLTPNASAADVIANVPNVNVDQDGKVTIRGNENTRIFVDGKASAMFSGPNGGDALNNYPADAIQRIEVITTPGAEFGSEGGGGPILNLVTSRFRRPGGQGSITAGVGTQGQHNAALNGSYNNGRFQVEGQTNFAHRFSNQDGWTDSTFRSANGTSWLTRRDSTGSRLSDSMFLNSKARYNIGETDRASIGLSFTRTNNTTAAEDAYVSYHDEVSPYEAYHQDRRIHAPMTTFQVMAGYEHVIGPDESISYDLRTSANERNSESRSHNTYIVLSPTSTEFESRFDNALSNYLTEISVDYNAKFGSNTSYKAGAKFGLNKGRSGKDYFAIDRLTGEEIFDGNRSTGYRSAERTYALYLTPTFTVSEHWKVQPGVRLEALDGNIKYIGRTNSTRDATTALLPSVHVQYAWGENQSSSIRGAYSRRVHRPSLADLNPNLQYVNDHSYSIGDPNLKPTDIDYYELQYIRSSKTLNLNLSIFHEKDSPLLGRVITLMSGTGAFLSQAVNFGAKIADGVSLDLQGRPLRSLNLGATLALRRVSQAYLSTQYDSKSVLHALEMERNSTSTDLKLRATYSGAVHGFTMNANYTGRALFGLSEAEPTWQATAGWSWKLNPRATLRSGITDVFNSSAKRITLDTITNKSTSYNKIQDRIFSIALTYSLGGVTGDSNLRNGISSPRRSSNSL